MDVDNFRFLLNKIQNGDEKSQVDARSEIMNIREKDINFFFRLILEIFKENASSPQINVPNVIICFSALCDTFIPNRNAPKELIQHQWMSEDFTNIRTCLKELLILYIQCNEVSVRNMAACVIARVLAIEEEQNWSDLFPQLLFLFMNENASVSQMHGVLVTFHEILNLPIFNKIKKINEINPSISQLLLGILQYISLHINKTLTDFSILCVLDFCQNLPIIFEDSERIARLLDVYPNILPFCDNNEYENLFRILFEIIKHSYFSYIPQFMSQIYELSVKGIICPNKDLVTISLHFWIEFCNYEKKLQKINKSRNISETAMTELFSVLLSLICNDYRSNENESKYSFSEICLKSVSLIRIFTLLYPTKMIEKSKSIISPVLIKDSEKFQELINKPRDFDKIFTILSLINGICIKVESSQNFSFLKMYFKDIVMLIFNNNLMISISAICALNRIVAVLNDDYIQQNAYRVVLDILAKDIPEILEPCVYQMIISLINASNKKIISEYFIAIFNLMMKKIKDPDNFQESSNSNLDDYSYNIDEASDINQNILENQFAVLMFLTEGSYKESQNVSNCYPEVFKLLSKFTSFVSFNQTYLVNYLMNLLRLTNYIIINQQEKFEVFADPLIELLIPCINKYSNIFFEDIACVLSALCRCLKDKLKKYSTFFIEIIHTGLFSQSPPIINSSMFLCCDLVTSVDQSITLPIKEMFDVIPQIPEIPSRFIIPYFIESVAHILNDGCVNNIPPEYCNSFIDFVIKKLDEVVYVGNVQNASEVLNINEFEYAQHIFNSSFYAFAAYFKYNYEPIKEKTMEASRFLKKYVVPCAKSKAYNIETVISLCKLLKELGRKFKGEISVTLNNRFIRSILTDPEIKIKNIEYRQEIKKTIEFIEDIY